MAWWGTLIGSTLGFMLGGPLGLLLGSVVGRQFDTGRQRTGDGPFLGNGREVTQAAFFTATFSVMGYLAKADGHVSAAEVRVAERLMDDMRLDARQRQTAIELFNRGKSGDFPLEAVLDQFRHECQRRTTLLRMFLEIQVQAALADGRIDPAENTVLTQVAQALGFDPGDVQRLIDFISGGTNDTGRETQSLDSAYQVLGVDSTASHGDLKKTYRRLMNQHHPDKMVARGMPEEMIKLATEKTQGIQKAWEVVREHRAKQVTR